MAEAGRVERRADRGHHAVHHAAGSHDVGASPCMAHRLPGEQLERRIVVDVGPPGLLVNDPAVAMIGVFAAANVGDDEHLGRDFADRLNRLLNNAVIRKRIAANRVLLRRDAE